MRNESTDSGRKRPEYTKQRRIEVEVRSIEVFIKNYKAARHKQQPKFRKQKLEKVYVSNSNGL